MSDSNVCQWPHAPVLTLASQDVDEAAERLACLLVDAAEFQNYVRLARDVRIDPQVAALVSEIRERESAYDWDPNRTRELEEQLDTLPVMLEYRQAETAMRELFKAVDRVISAAAGAPFAENAKPAACG